MEDTQTRYTPKFGHSKPHSSGIEYSGDRLDVIHKKFKEHNENTESNSNHVKSFWFRFKFFLKNFKRYIPQHFEKYQEKFEESEEYVIKR